MSVSGHLGERPWLAQPWLRQDGLPLAMTADLGGDHTPISSFPISSWSIFCTLLLAT